MLDSTTNWNNCKLLSNLILGLNHHNNDENSGTIIRVNGPINPSQRLPNTLSIDFKDIHSSKLLSKIETF